MAAPPGNPAVAEASASKLSKPAITFAPPADGDRVSSELAIRVPDCSAAYEVLRSRGAEFLTPPVDWGYEVRAFFRDPDGHLLEISQTGQ